MRHLNPQVRILALQTLHALFARLSEDYVPLLPETLPVLAELMEDENENVERECKNIIRSLEEITGEDIEKHLS